MVFVDIIFPEEEAVQQIQPHKFSATAFSLNIDRNVTQEFVTDSLLRDIIIFPQRAATVACLA